MKSGSNRAVERKEETKRRLVRRILGQKRCDTEAQERRFFVLSLLCSFSSYVPVPNIDSHEFPGSSAIVRRLPRSSIFSLMWARNQTKSLYRRRTSQFLFLKLGRVVYFEVMLVTNGLIYQFQPESHRS